ncbi:MAG TPA: DUF4843 domain-containing protein [Chitinophaga sp.]|uniref:DUF4843 domain-containing protein n=1 Tax=Chitinophaga sp. TaxID=1869181 RepID=UPI002C1DAF51|nr:DUF4843 domain-containing protein [Chitinophaga sp.]HVI44129.1 DUF4843 domain-containing protein [Chitinophaga sp.]
MKKIIFYCLIICLAAGCTKSELMQYEGNASIFFSNAYRAQYGPSYDTFHYSFAIDTLKSYNKLKAYVYVSGEVTANSRTFTLAPDAGTTTAVAGRHYILPVADSLIIPAGQVSRIVPITLLRPADLYEKSVTLTLKLLPDNNFKTSIPVYDHNSTYVKSIVTMRIVIDDILAKPGLWDANQNALGSYSRLKLERMVKELSLSLTRFYSNPNSFSSPPYSAPQLTNFARQLQAYLRQQQQAGHPVLEADGSIMKMGPAVQ